MKRPYLSRWQRWHVYLDTYNGACFMLGLRWQQLAREIKRILKR